MISPLVRELLTWISERSRTYEETMLAWRSNCPRHAVWEDVCIEGYVEVIEAGGEMNSSRVVLTALGNAVLDAESGHS